LLDSENELFQSKRSYANAQYDQMFAFARTHAGMGMLHQALGLSRQEPGALPDFGRQDDQADVVQNCPNELPQTYVIDKAKLNERARDYVFNTPTGALPPAVLPVSPPLPTPAPVPSAALAPTPITRFAAAAPVTSCVVAAPTAAPAKVRRKARRSTVAKAKTITPVAPCMAG
jgi:adhesin transport system outer membrane protein